MAENGEKNLLKAENVAGRHREVTWGHQRPPGVMVIHVVAHRAALTFQPRVRERERRLVVHKSRRQNIN